MRYQYELFKAEALAKTIYNKLDLSTGEVKTFAIPGGRSPGPILKALASLCSSEDLQSLVLTWVDERYVEADSSDRNDLATLNAWREGGILPKTVIPMPTKSEDIQKDCVTYENNLKAKCDNLKINVSLLGIGEDGHFASLFPNHPLLNQTENVLSLKDSPKPPSERITLSLPLIDRSDFKCVLCFGEQKGEVFKKVLQGKDKQYPISLLSPENTIWYLDEAALSAAGLK